MKNKKINYTLTFIGFFIVALFFSYKPILRWQVEKRIPGVEFQDVSLNSSGIILSSVKLDRGWIKGSLNTVSSDFQGQHILVEGGSLSVNLEERPKKEDNKQKRDIQFNNLNVKTVYQKYNVNLQGVRSSGDQICFSEARLEVPSALAIDGCFKTQNKIVSVEIVKLENLKFMNLQLKDSTAHQVKFNLDTKTLEIELIKTQLSFENQVASIEAKNVHAFKDSKSVHIDSAKILHPWLSSDWVTIKNIEAKGSDKWSLTVGSSHVQVDPDTLSFSGSEECSTWIDSLPETLKSSPLDTIHFTGKVNFSIGLRPKPVFNIKSDCKAICNSVPNLRKPFYYTAYTPSREPFERQVGPNSKEWLPIELMGDMPLAAITMEDPGFKHHHGFISQAFLNSLTDNLKEGKFLRGGSTITMQLAKNIWLTRDKTLSRKLQEFFLAQAIESCYSKEEILELYLNVVEFGPNKYGVAAGTQHWFKKIPLELTPAESFWMASILPRPSRTSPPNDLSIKRIEALMKRLAVDGKIPEFMLNDAVILEDLKSEN